MRRQRQRTSATVFAELNESGGAADAVPKTRGGASGGRRVLDDAVPESGGVTPVSSSRACAPEEPAFEMQSQAVGWRLLGSCDTRALRFLAVSQRRRAESLRVVATRARRSGSAASRSGDAQRTRGE